MAPTKRTSITFIVFLLIIFSLVLSSIFYSQLNKVNNHLKEEIRTNDQLRNQLATLQHQGIFLTHRHTKYIFDSCSFKKDLDTNRRLLLKAQGNNLSDRDLSRIGAGEWSDDCKKLVYQFFWPRGWGSDGYPPVEDDQYSGLWYYNSDTQKAVKLTNFLSTPYHWISSDLIVADNAVIDINTKNMITFPKKFNP